jgi:peptidyl-prolyl cis-trans isomerase A (cyclophilin A)
MNMKLKNLFLVLLSLNLTIGFAQGKKKSPKAKAKTEQNEILAEINTSKGQIIINLEFQKTPITVANFIALAEGTNLQVTGDKKGKPFYDGLKFHRVIKDFMIQGGDPLGTGAGDPGYKFKDEFDASLKHSKPGILSMANSGPKTNGSQFFITHKETPWLDNKHTVFGSVKTGQNIVDAIAQDDVIKTVKIIRNGKLAKAFNASKVFNDYFINKDNDEKLEKEKAQKAKDAAAAEYKAKFGTVINAKLAEINANKAKATAKESGLKITTITPGNGVKPADGTPVYVHYAGYFEDGTLFDSSYENVNKDYGKFDQNRSIQNGYQPFPYEFAKKGGLIPGFLEGLNNMTFGEKVMLFIPSNLGYGERGAGGVIPPNTNLVFELEMLEKAPEPKK